VGDSSDQEHILLLLTNNQLCPPYPDCISIVNQVNQDISNCP